MTSHVSGLEQSEFDMAEPASVNFEQPHFVLFAPEEMTQYQFYRVSDSNKNLNDGKSH